MHSNMIVLAAIIASLSWQSCRSRPQTSSNSSLAKAEEAVVMQKTDPSNAQLKTLLAADWLAYYRGILPAIDEEAVTQALNDPMTMWYDDRAMPPAYQDSDWAVTGSDIGVKPNDISANRIAATPLPLQNGHFIFPFGFPAGTDQCANCALVNFLHLPLNPDTGKVWPVVYWTWPGSHRRDWMFPIGTIVGELLMMERKKNDFYIYEIRVRKRYKNGWWANAYRPFPTRQDLIDKITAVRPKWESDPQLKALIDHLNNTGTLQSDKLESPYKGGMKYNGYSYTLQWDKAFSQSGYLDMLPDIDGDLVGELLRKTTFVSAEGAIWKSDGKKETYAASTAAKFSIVPQNYRAGLIAVNETSCTRCHENTGRPMSDFSDLLRIYGEIWGSDRIFSWHPFNPEGLRSPTSTLVNYEFRDEFVKQGIIAAWDEKTASKDIYNTIVKKWR